VSKKISRKEGLAKTNGIALSSIQTVGARLQVAPPMVNLYWHPTPGH